MGSFSILHLLILAVVVFLLFGRGKVSDLMGDFAKGIKNFKKGLAEDDEHETPRVISSDNHRTDTQSTVHHDETKEKAGQ